MDKLQIEQSFHVWVPTGNNPDGTPKPERKVSFAKGQVVEPDQVPEGQTAESWIEKGLAKAVS